MKLGELVGLAARNATLEALRWQNGLEASYTRGVFHALGRYGVKEATLFDDIAPLLGEADLELLKKNAKAAFYEPLVGAAAHALATVVRSRQVRHHSAKRSRPMRWCSRRRRSRPTWRRRSIGGRSSARTLRPHANGDVKALVLRALALGLVGKVANWVIQLLAPLSPGPACCWRSASSPTSPSATPSMRGTPCGSSEGR